MLDPVWRRATAADAAGLTALVRLAYAKYEARIGSEPGPMRDDYGVIIETRVVWLVEQDGELTAALVLQPQDDGLLVENIAVHPERQNNGLGTRLLASAEHQARRAGLPVVRLYTHASMTENVDLYERRGYTVTGLGTQDGLSRVFLEKRLDHSTKAERLGLSVTLVNPPALVTSGRSVGLQARLRNDSTADLYITCTDSFRAALLDEQTGDLVGGLWGFRTLTARGFELPAASEHVLSGQVEARRTSRGPTAKLLPGGDYLMSVDVRLHLRYPDRTEHLLDVAAPLHGLTVTTSTRSKPLNP